VNPRPLPLAYWEALRPLSEPFELMKFTLIYDGDLPASGNKPKPVYASTIRNEFHDQLADLWDSHVILRQLARTARAPIWIHQVEIDGSEPPLSTKLDDFRGPAQPMEPGQIDLCAPIEVTNVGSFIPLVRHSLHLACAVDIIFLRHEEPLTLMKSGGDLDGRLKTLFDALRMPEDDSQQAGVTLTSDPLYVLMQDDILVSDVSIKTGRLLGSRTKKPHAVRLTIDVTVKVLRVFEQNQCLIGG
jgi:hypothetical protein